jgi:protein-tyrosine phosphatase
VLHRFSIRKEYGKDNAMNRVFMKFAGWLSRPERGFSAASEQEPFVYGARRPGYLFPRVPSPFVHSWIAFMQAQGIKRVLCLLSSRQLAAYDDLLGAYHRRFGEHNVLWVPIEDFHLAEEAQLIDQILPFLAEADRRQEKTVVHCSGGVGRTGHVLAAWLVSYRGMSNEEAIAAVKRQGRNARESGDKRLDTLLDRCREAFSRAR